MNNLSKKNIRLFQPSVDSRELDKVKEVIDRAWLGGGPLVSNFEEAWSKHIGSEVSVALNSCTAALHLALLCQNFPRGKKVLVPSMTFASTAVAPLYCGLEPVFVDSNKDTLGMCIDDLKNKYDKDCVAVIPVHLGGHPVEMEKLVPWAREKKLLIIEDCAHTSGSNYKGTNLGMWGDIGCYSFEEKKIMATGDGGMICTNNPSKLNNIRAHRWIGMDKDNWKTAKEYVSVNRDAMHWFYEISVLGYKYNMNDLAAALGIVQLEKLEDMNSIRKTLMLRYCNGIKKIKGVDALMPYQPNKYVYWFFGIKTLLRDELMIYLKSKGIATGCHYTPLHHQPLFRQYKSQCPVSERAYDSFMTLPFHTSLTNDDIDYILSHLSEFSKKNY